MELTFGNYYLQDFTQSFYQHRFFFIVSKGFPVMVRTQLLGMLANEKGTDRQKTSELSYVRRPSNLILLKINNLAFTCLLQLFRKIGA